MPITGTFKGDFSNFVAAVESAEHALVDLEAGSGRVEKSLNRMVDQFSGRKLIQDAALMVEAVERIGGASNLTEKELQSLGAKAAEAAEKMRAMGLDVPAKLQNLADAGTKTSGVFSTLGTDVVKMTTSFFTAQAALDLLYKAFDLAVAGAQAFGAMVLEGSEVGDVAENFERLASAIGSVGDELLGALREGTQATVSDFELMKIANSGMAAGLNLTAGEMRTMAEGAFALAQATGGNVTDALKTMTDAMVTGKAKSIEARFGMVDLEKAEDAFAASIGRTREQLTEDQKLHVDRIAIFERVRDAVGRLGEQQAGLDERVAQAQVAWENFRNELGRSIAQSPVIEAAMVSLKNELARAFGGDQEKLIKNITGLVEQFAIKAVEASKWILEAGGAIIKEWIEIETMFSGVLVVIDGIVLGVSDLALRLSKIMAALGNDQAVKDVAALEASTASLRQRIDENIATMGRSAERHREVNTAVAEGKRVLDGVVTAMQAAAAGHTAVGTAAATNADGTLRVSRAQIETTTTTQGATAALGLYNSALDSNAEKVTARTEREKKMAAADAAALKELNKLADLHTAMEAALRGTTGASYDFTDAQLAEIDALTQLGFSTDQIATRFGLLPVQIKQAQDALKLWGEQSQATTALQTELDTMAAASTKTRVDQQLAQAERWFTTTRQKMIDERTLTTENEALLVQLYQSKVDQIMGISNSLTEHTRGAVEQRATIERNRLNDMIAHWDQWGTAAILKQEQVALAAEDAARNFDQPWNSALDNVQGHTKTTIDAMSTSFMQFGVLVTGATEGAAAAMSTSFMENGVLVVGAAADTARGIVDAHRGAAHEVVTTWSQAMEQVRQGKGEMSGAIPSGGPGTMTNYGEWGSPEHQAFIARMAAQGRYFGPVTHRGTNPAYPGYESAGANIIGPDWEALGMTTPPGGTSWAMLGGKENAYQMKMPTWGGQFRAEGGPVEPGKPYLVGEHGPELFLPNDAGAILPNRGLGTAPAMGSSVVMHNVFNINGTGADVARIVSAELTRLMRQGRKWPAV